MFVEPLFCSDTDCCDVEQGLLVGEGFVDGACVGLKGVLVGACVGAIVAHGG